MKRRPPRSTRTDTLFPYPTLFRSFTYGLIESARVGTAATLTTLLLAAAAFVGLLIYEPRRREPLLDLRFFRSLPFSSATVIARSEEDTSELQSLMRISYAVFCLKKKKNKQKNLITT